MSERSVIISVILAAAMVGLWLWVDSSTQQAEAGPVPLIDFDPAMVQKIEVARGQEQVWIGREELFGRSRWMVHWGAGEAARMWPADEGKVRAGLRVLSTSTLEPRDRGEEHPDGGVLKLTMADGSVRGLSFAGDALAGRVGVWTSSGGRGLADASLYDAFIRTGLEAWRDEHAMLALGVGPSRLHLENPTGALALGRREGRWAMFEPLAVRADADAARSLSDLLANTLIERFSDGPKANDAYGFSKPLATVVAETDFRYSGADGRTSSGVLRQRMVVGGPTDATGQEVYVQLDWTRLDGQSAPVPMAGPVVATVAVESLNKLTTRPEPYISKVTVPELSARVGSMTVRAGGATLSVLRSVSGWSTEHDPLMSADSETMDALLKILTEAEADGVSIIDPTSIPQGAPLKVLLAQETGVPPTEVEVLTDGDGLLTVVDQVARKYDGKADLMAQLVDVLDRLGEGSAN